MNIDKITIQNFRNIGPETSFEFKSKFTVIIGINGKGKSTILHALRVACGAFFLAIPDVKKRHIAPHEIRQEDSGKYLINKKPVIVKALGKVGKMPQGIVWWRQIKENSNSTTSSEEEVGIIRDIGLGKFSKITKEGLDNEDLPVIAFFGTSRANSVSRIRKSRIGRQIFKEGYLDWYEMKASNYKYEDWLNSYEVLLDEGKEYTGTGKAFLDSLRKANPYILDVKVVGGKLWIRVKIDDYESDLLPIELHSDGIRFFTEMVAELAYRCVVLNGYLDEKAIEGTTGVVMIDEIDLHLHPNWQRHVVHDLKNAFPNIQFVVTTHSPFIVQSLKSEELIILDEDIKKDGDPFKKSLEEVAAHEMGVVGRIYGNAEGGRGIFYLDSSGKDQRKQHPGSGIKKQAE